MGHQRGILQISGPNDLDPQELKPIREAAAKIGESDLAHLGARYLGGFLAQLWMDTQPFSTYEYQVLLNTLHSCLYL